MSAPCPPMECPKIDWRVRSCAVARGRVVSVWKFHTGWDGDEEDEGTYDGKLGGLDDLREFERDVGEHVVVLRPLRVRRVHVEARALGTFAT